MPPQAMQLRRAQLTATQNISYNSTTVTEYKLLQPNMAAVGLDQLGHGITGSKSSRGIAKRRRFTVSSVYRLTNLTTELTEFLRGTEIHKFCAFH
jgi:hypothetical protein